MSAYHSFAYVECDLLEGQTLREWQVARSAPHMSLWARFCAWRHRGD